MRNKPIILVLLLFVPGLAAGNVNPDFPPAIDEVYINFNEPKGTVDAFYADAPLRLRNPSEEPVTFSNLNVTVKGITGITVTPIPTTLTVEPDSYDTVTLTFSADPTMAERRYHSVTLTVTGKNVNERSTIITIEIDHPPPTINATWSPADLGDVKAGSTLSNILTVSEVMGYNSVEDLSISVYDTGPIENITYSGSLGDFDPLTSKDIEVNFSIPQRNLRPGSYSVVPLITSTSLINANAQELRYTIPVPKIQVDPSAIDFEKITFETGKDTKTVALNVSETGGYTPIEKLSFSLLNGEEGWITHTEEDYIPAGGSRIYKFNIFLLPDASLGFKRWDFRLDTLYAGSKDIPATVIVSFPGTDEAVAFLKNTSSVTNSTKEKNLIRDTISLLETSKDKTQLRKIAMVMSVYSGTRTFLSNLDTAVNSKKLIEASDAMIRAKAALTKMKIGDQNLKDAELKVHSSKIVSSTEQIWESEARKLVNSLEENAENEKDSNYKITALYYNRISRIYSLLNDPQNTKKYLEKQNDMEKLYHNSLLEAGVLNRDADSKLESAREQTLKLGEDTYLVLNPFSYDFVSITYDEAIEEYERAEVLYRKTGEDSDADLMKAELEKITRQKNNIYRAFIVYGSVLGLIFLWFIGRVVWGLQRYTKDEMDGRWGDVITGGEVITGEKPEGK